MFVGLPRSSISLLSAALKSEQPHVQIYAVTALADLGADAAPAVPALTEALEDKNPVVTLKVVAVLKAIGPKADEAASALVKCLDQKKASTLRVRAAAALVSMNKELKPAITTLLDAVKAASDELKKEAAAALEEIGPSSMEEAAIPLIRALSKEFPELHALAATVLVRMGKTGVPRIRKLLKDKDPDLRLAGVVILGKIGPDARSALTDLRFMTLKREERYVHIREAAELACKEIDEK